MAVQVLDPGEKTPSELARTANEEHRLVLEAGAAMIEHAIACGETLLQAQASFDETNWSEWVQARGGLTFSPTAAYNYMRIAHWKDVVREYECASITAAVKVLKARHLTLAGRDRKGREKPSRDARREEAVRLRETGLSQRRIAELLGTSQGVVCGWLNPEFRARNRERDKIRKRRRAAERRALQEAEERSSVRTIVKTAGGAIAEAYAMAEKMQDVLGQAHREATDSEARRVLAMAGEHHRKMRDEIVRALGVS